jgi:hypothetical protein
VKQIHFYPYPGSNATVPYHYYKKLADLTDGGSANVLTTFYPDLYITGAAWIVARDEKFKDRPETVQYLFAEYQRQIDLVKKAQRQSDKVETVRPKRILPSTRRGLHVQTSGYTS